MVNCYVIAMPIGDELSDISCHAINILKIEKYIFCEHIANLKLLNEKFGISFKDKKIITINHEDKELKALKLIKILISQKRDFVILGDYGIPCFCDPGAEIMDQILRNYLNQVKICPIGIASALDTALILLGKSASNNFIFLRYSDKKQIAVEDLLSKKMPLILFIKFNDLYLLFEALQKIKYGEQILLVANLAKKEIIEKKKPVYKLFLGKLIQVARQIDKFTKDDEIIVALYSQEVNNKITD
jgi:16S rRNA C1402 (ribose-2'-O) methylase RsmI